jgi:hypothetical protein
LWWSKRGWGGCLGWAGWIRPTRGMGSAGGWWKIQKSGIVRLERVKNWCNNQLITLKSHPLRAASMAKRMRLFSGAEGMYYSHPQQWHDGPVRFAKFRVRGGGETHHRPRNNQPLTLLFDTLLAAWVRAIVQGSLLLFCDWKPCRRQRKSHGWDIRRSVGCRLVVALMARSVCACVVLVSQRSLPESKSFDSVTLLPVTI